MSSSGVAARWSRAQQAEWIEWAVSRYVEWLLSLDSIKIRLVILFGSYVRGTFDEESDVDVLVVADGLPENNEAIDLLTFDVPEEVSAIDFEPHPYSPEDFIASLKVDGRATNALVEGQVLHIDDDYRRELLAVL